MSVPQFMAYAAESIQNNSQGYPPYKIDQGIFTERAARFELASRPWHGRVLPLTLCPQWRERRDSNSQFPLRQSGVLTITLRSHIGYPIPVFGGPGRICTYDDTFCRRKRYYFATGPRIYQRLQTRSYIGRNSQIRTDNTTLRELRVAVTPCSHMVGTARLELALSWLKARCVDHLHYAPLAAGPGFEPGIAGSEPTVLPITLAGNGCRSRIRTWNSRFKACRVTSYTNRHSLG